MSAPLPASPSTPAGGTHVDEVQRHGRLLLTRVSLLLKTASLHQLSNAALKAPIAALLEAANPILQESGEGGLFLQAIGENIFFNRQLIRLDFQTYDSAAALRSVFGRINVQELSITSAIAETDVREFLVLFQTCLHSKARLPAQKLGKIRVRTIDKARKDELASSSIDERQNLLRCYALLGISVEEALRRLATGKPPQFARLRRALHGLADASVGKEGLLIGLTRLPSLAGQPHFHMAAVAACCLLMGRRLGLGRGPLTEIALAALFHDVARDDDAAATEPGDDGTRVGIRSMLCLCAADSGPEMLKIAATAREVGLPASNPDEDQPNSLARLIAVPCLFDLLCSPRAGSRALLPDEALRLILDSAPSRFDPRAARLFATTVGLYPVGTTVRLSGGEIALVLEVSPDPAQFARPRVKVLRSDTGPADFVLDLADPQCEREIVCSIPPEDAGPLNVAQLLLA